MGFGVLEDHSTLAHVPGTVFLDDETARGEDAAAVEGLKHGRGRDAHIVLAPQPSDDPNDPLNWPMWRKELVTAILCLGAMLNAGTNGPLLNASYVAIAETLDRPLTSVVLVSGYNLLAAGCIGPFVCAFSRKYGKRPVFLASTLLAIAGTAVGEAQVSYTYLLAARITQGFSTSAFESLIVSTVGDMYFVHQRGLRVSLINFVLNSASSLASIICGQVFADLGWLWLFHLFQIFLVVQFVAMFLFCPETTYIRETRLEVDLDRGGGGGGGGGGHPREKGGDVDVARYHHDEEAGTRGAAAATPPPRPPPSSSSTPPQKKKTFAQSLTVFTGVYSTDSFFKFLLGPLLTLLNPAACYAILTSGLLNSWYVGSAIILSGVFSGPPWNFGPAQVGYIGAGPFIGGMIGSVIVGWGSDPVVKWMAKKNSGVYEPEFRLVFMSLAMVMCGLGMFLFGYAMVVGAAAELCAFLQGVMMVGVLVGIFSALAYALDAFRAQSSEMFIMNMFFKNFMFYGLSSFANDWVAAKGPGQIMYVFGGTSIFLCLLALPVYVYGKRLRAWWARHDLFVALGMETTAPGAQHMG